MSAARRIALFPASFDPVTNGHLDIARRALRDIQVAVRHRIEAGREQRDPPRSAHAFGPP